MVELSPQQSAAVKSFQDWWQGVRNGGMGEHRIAGLAGTGKAQPLTAMIQTPIGPIPMGEIQLGQEVLGVDGKPTRVVGIYPQGVKKAYRVTFRDGTHTECSEDHLWLVDQGKGGNLQVKTLREVADKGLRFPSGAARFRIPICKPVEFDSEPAPYDPYTIGALLGDGYIKGNVTALVTPDMDIDIVERVTAALPEGFAVRRDVLPSCPRYILKDMTGHGKWNRLKEHLANQEIRIGSRDKFIPRPYLLAPVDDRFALLHGLMDTDGSVTGNRTSFCTTSERMVQDFCFLVRSLGGVAIPHRFDRAGRGVEFQINVKMHVNPFSCQRKASKWSPSWKNPPSRYIFGVEEIGEVEQQCIKVMAPDGLYLTDDFIVTHNTTIVPDLLQVTGLKPDQIAFLGPTGKSVKVLKKKLKDQGVGSEASTIHSAIYHPQIQSAEALEERLERLKKQLNGGDPYLDEAKAHEYQEKIRITEENLRRIYLSKNLEFQLNPDSERLLASKLVIVDEASMVDDRIANDLRGFDVPILAIGDPGQLPPVGGAPGFDLNHPDSFLTEIHRQAADNPILWLAHRLREGQEAKVGNYGDRLRVVRKKDDDVTFDTSRDVQVICGRNQTRWDITRQIRHLSGFGHTGPVAGELMICVRNSKKRPSLVNGAMFMVDDDVGDLASGDSMFKMGLVDEEGSKVQVKAVQALLEENYLGKGKATVDDRAVYKAKMTYEHFDWAYAITCHKSQGSQWDEVCVHDEGWCFREDAARWNYTAATRAAERLTWVV